MAKPTKKPAKPASTTSDFDRVWKIASALGLPQLQLGTSFGKSSMKVGTKFVGWVKVPGVLVTHCPIEFKELLLQSKSGLYFETDHYGGWPAIEMRLDKATDADIAESVTRAWLHQAPERLVRQRQSGGKA